MRTAASPSRRKGLDYTTTLQLQVGSTVMYINGEAAELDAAPANIDGILYFPLRAVAQAFEHSVYWESRFPDSSEIYVIYTAAELYIWNTQEEFSDGSLRYVLLQGTLDEKPFEEIYSRATPDYHELLNRLSAAPVNGITLCPLYPIKGYKVPESIVHDLGDKIHCGNYLSAGAMWDILKDVLTKFRRLSLWQETAATGFPDSYTRFASPPCPTANNRCTATL